MRSASERNDPGVESVWEGGNLPKSRLRNEDEFKGEQRLTAEAYPSETVDSQVSDGEVEGNQRPGN